MSITSIEEAKPTTKQHKKPCHDCPWRRKAVKGWLGGVTVNDWLLDAHGEAKIDCHTKLGPQCAGAAIYRANVLKSPRDKTLLVLPEDKENVFASSKEFDDHHRVNSELVFGKDGFKL